MSEYNGEIKKMMIILSKATLENVYAAFVLANGARMEGIQAEIFFTFFGLEAIHNKKLEHLHVATVGNPAMAYAYHVGWFAWNGSPSNFNDEEGNGENRYARYPRVLRYS
jgi:peroxiredoxin family protein